MIVKRRAKLFMPAFLLLPFLFLTQNCAHDAALINSSSGAAAESADRVQFDGMTFISIDSTNPCPGEQPAAARIWQVTEQDFELLRWNCQDLETPIQVNVSIKDKPGFPRLLIYQGQPFYVELGGNGIDTVSVNN